MPVMPAFLIQGISGRGQCRFYRLLTFPICRAFSPDRKCNATADFRLLRVWYKKSDPMGLPGHYLSFGISIGYRYSG